MVAHAVTVDAVPSVESVIARLERLPISRELTVARIVIGSATFFDAYTVLAIAYAMPVLAREWNLTPGQIGAILSAGYLGQFFGALFFAAFQIVTSRLSSVDDTVTTNLFSGLGALLVLCVTLAVVPLDVVPTLRHASPTQWMLIGVVGVVATTGQMCMALAIRCAPLSTLTPFGYAQIAFAAMISWVVFKDAPDPWAAAGMGLIAFGGAATVWLNARESA